MITRRGLLGGILAVGFAPAAIGSGILMPVRQLALPTYFSPGNEVRGGLADQLDEARVEQIWSLMVPLRVCTGDYVDLLLDEEPHCTVRALRSGSVVGVQNGRLVYADKLIARGEMPLVMTRVKR